jgi:serine/threonine-protein kinase
MINHPDFKFIRLLGEGGFGQVGLYFQAKENRYVAIKSLKNVYDPVTRARFQQEIELSKRLNGTPNIVEIFFYENSSNPTFYGMPYYGKGNLRNILDQKGKFTDKEALNIIRMLTETLIPIHNQGIIHRDLKPENILIDDYGQFKISDWGLGKPSYERSNTLTKGLGMGTPIYCAPEQLAGSGSDHRSDVYSLGIIFTELLTGSRQGKPKGNFTNRIINKATANAPENRYQNLGMLLDDIKELSTRKNATNFGKKVLDYLPEITLFGALGYVAYQAGKMPNEDED